MDPKLVNSQAPIQMCSLSVWLSQLADEYRPVYLQSCTCANLNLYFLFCWLGLTLINIFVHVVEHLFRDFFGLSETRNWFITVDIYHLLHYRNHLNRIIHTEMIQSSIELSALENFLFLHINANWCCLSFVYTSHVEISESSSEVIWSYHSKL